MDARPENRPIASGVHRERINLILLDVVVTDRKGRRVDDLRPDEFLLTVDGHPHPIESVELQWAEGPAPGPSALPPEGARRPQTAARAAPARFNRRFVLFFDGLNSERGLGIRPIEAARRFLQTRPAGEEVMVAGQGRDFKIYQHFTSDHARLLAALDAVAADPQIRTAGENRVWANLRQMEEEKDLRASRGGRQEGEAAVQALAAVFAQQDRDRILRVLASLRALVAYLHTRTGRTELFFLTDGFPSDPGAFYGAPNEPRMEGDILRIAREAAAAQVVIHTLNTQGIPRESDAVLQRLSDRPWGIVIEREASDTLSAFALGTGGVASHLNNDFEAALARVEEETRASYLLAYVPAGQPDGKYHSTKVEVRRKGVRVRAREGFIWMTDEELRERELLAAHLSPELFRDVPLALEVRTYLEEDGVQALEIALGVPVPALLFLPREGEYVAQVEAGMIFRSPKNEIADRFSRGIEVPLAADDFARGGDLTLLAQRKIPPGDYEAVAVVRDLESGKVGALKRPIKVPALVPERIAMSSLILRNADSRTRRVDIDPATSQNPRLVVPTVQRVFPRNTRVLASCLVYHPRREAATGEARVRVKGSIRKGTEIVRELPGSVHVVPADQEAEAIPLEFPLAVQGLDPGIYTLEVQALDEVAGRGIVQSVDFMVR